MVMRHNNTIILKNDIAELETLTISLEEFFEEKELSPQVLFQVNLALDELVTNIISYAYLDDVVHEIIIELRLTNNRLMIILSDDGVPFNPLAAPEHDINQPLEEREVGGLGIHFVRTTMENLTYQRLDGRNILSFEKSLSV